MQLRRSRTAIPCLPTCCRRSSSTATPAMVRNGAAAQSTTTAATPSGEEGLKRVRHNDRRFRRRLRTAVAPAEVPSRGTTAACPSEIAISADLSQRREPKRSLTPTRRPLTKSLNDPFRGDEPMFFVRIARCRLHSPTHDGHPTRTARSVRRSRAHGTAGRDAGGQLGTAEQQGVAGRELGEGAVEEFLAGELGHDAQDRAGVPACGGQAAAGA